MPLTQRLASERSSLTRITELPVAAAAAAPVTALSGSGVVSSYTDVVADDVALIDALRLPAEEAVIVDSAADA